MLAELRMALSVDKEGFGYYQSSNMQGVLMEHLENSYAEKLHQQGLKPYSQHIEGREEKEWVIKTFTKEAYQEIITPLLCGEFSGFCIEKKDMHVKILEKRLKTMGKGELLEEFYSGSLNRHILIEFLTPTSFKSDGKYLIITEIRHLYQSLMNKYSAASDELTMCDQETLGQLTENSSIEKYRLRSTCFPLEGVKIPAFMGELGIYISGTETMARYARLLFRFGEYAGVGIKTAMGMGALRIKEAKK